MRKMIVAALAAMVALGGIGLASPASAAPAPKTVEVWKSRLCGCCGGWVEYMEAKGYAVTVHNDDDMEAVKNRLGVPEDVRSCHTAKIGDYVIEGHVPVEAIDKLFAERPKVTGIAAPGMPQGSPGMNGKKEPNVVVTFGGGAPKVFGRY
ncbi:MAG: DUF411 domain-containing protein [Solirubrobacterales bacterium]